MFWAFDKRDHFSVKSAYHLALSLREASLPSPFGRTTLAKSWMDIWKAGVIPEIKHVCWKILNNIILPLRISCQKESCLTSCVAFVGLTTR